MMNLCITQCTYWTPHAGSSEQRIFNYDNAERQ